MAYAIEQAIERTMCRELHDFRKFTQEHLRDWELCCRLSRLEMAIAQAEQQG